MENFLGNRWGCRFDSWRDKFLHNQNHQELSLRANRTSSPESGCSRNGQGFTEVKWCDEPSFLQSEGNNTWEAVRRAKEVHRLQTVVVVTDAFHAPRSTYLCHHFGIEATAYCSGNESFGFWFLRYHGREWLARVKAFFQVLID
jgi:hypothetical protein